jgi:hypothetical protein
MPEDSSGGAANAAPTMTTGGATPSGNNNGGRGNSRRQSGRSGRGNPPRRTTAQPIKKFEGREEDLKAHVYDFTKETANSYKTTTEEIAEYVGRNYPLGNNVKRAIESMAHVPVTRPTAPVPTMTGGNPDPIDPVDMEIFKQEVAGFVKKRDILRNSMQKAFSLIYGQCSPGIRAKIESMPNHAQITIDGDPIELLKNLKSVMYNFQSTKYTAQAIYEAKRRFYMHRQADAEVPDYYKTFRNNLEVIEHNGGSFGMEPSLTTMGLAKIDPALTMDSATPAQIAEAAETGKEAAMACAFLLGADRKRFGKLIEDLENSFTQGHDKFPKTLSDAYKLLVNWKQDPRHLVQLVRGNAGNGTDTGAEVAFANVGEEGTSRTSRDTSNIQCYNCQQFGRYTSNCSNEAVARNQSSSNNDDV